MEVQGLVAPKGFDEWLKYVTKYRTYFLAGLLAITVAVGAGIYWYFYTIKYEESAQQAFSEVLHDYNQAYATPELWSEVEIGAKTGYRQYTRSALGPFFLAMQSEALLQQQKEQEALALMKMMLKKLSSRSSFYSLYKIKEARMKMDSDSEVVRQEGVRQLTSLANDEKNRYQDEALYYLGMYYQTQGQKDKAQDVLRQLSAIPSSPLASSDKQDDKHGQSPWFLLAEQQLKQG